MIFLNYLQFVYGICEVPRVECAYQTFDIYAVHSRLKQEEALAPSLLNLSQECHGESLEESTILELYGLRLLFPPC